MNSKVWVFFLTMILFRFGFAEERQITDQEGFFVIEYDHESTPFPRLSLAIWKDGCAIRDIAPQREKPQYRLYKMPIAKVERLSTKLTNDGLFASPKFLLDYGVPDAPHTSINIKIDQDAIEMNSSIEQFENGDKLVALESGIVPKYGKDRFALLESQRKEFLLKRLLWCETSRLFERSFLGLEPTPIDGSLILRKGVRSFEFKRNSN